MPTSNVNIESGAKRRACDECRARKLSCSKNVDGCKRCIRDNIKCHYSQQKPMGRPRKRQLVEDSGDEPIRTQNEQPTDFHDAPALPLFDDGFNNYNDQNIVDPYLLDLNHPEIPAESLPIDISDARLASTTNDGRVIWHFGSNDLISGPPIDFNNMDSTAGIQNTLPVDQPPQLPVTPEISFTNSNGLLENSPLPCSCLASMCLSLTALQQLPSDFTEALRVVRRACITAGTSIWCPSCGVVALTNATVPAPMEGFQNMMLLGTILPVIANGYSRLLNMIDEKTAEANATRQTINFQYLEYTDYGGYCEKQKSMLDSMACVGDGPPFSDGELQPSEWRTAVRALLRVDIYGHEQPGFKYKGLKDLITDVEERQRVRHNIIDAQAAAGSDIAQGHFTGLKSRICYDERTRTCLDILKMAKVTVDSIVIA